VIAISSSRSPSRRVRSFIKELYYSLPNTIRITRGKLSLTGLMEVVVGSGAFKLLYVQSRGGDPGILKLMYLSERGDVKLSYDVDLYGVKLLLDFDVGVLRRARRARSAIIARLERSELGDVLSDFLEYQTIYVDELNDVRGLADTVVVVRETYRKSWTYEVQILDGISLGPRGPILRVNDVRASR